MQIDSYVSERQKKRKKRRAYVYGVIGFLILYFVVVAIGWIIFRSPLFKVNNVVVKGNVGVSTDAIVSLLESSALRDPSFIKEVFGFRSMVIWPDRLTDDDMKLIPLLATASIEKDYFTHTITVTVTERQPFAIWCLMARVDKGAAPTDEQCYWIDSTGMVFNRAFDTEGSLLFAVHDYSNHKLGLNEKILPDQFFTNAISILNVLRQSGLKVNEVALNDLSLEEIDVTTFDGPNIYFSLRFPANNDLQVIQSVMTQPGFSKLQYIDARTENRIYVK